MIDFRRMVVLAFFSLVATGVCAQTMPTTEGNHSQTRQLAKGKSFGYGLHLPKNVNKRKNMPLVVALHFGWGGDAAPQDYGFKFMEWMMSPAFGDAIIVAPSALTQGWHSKQNTDALFELIKDIKANYSIDNKKILLTGYSAGAFGTWSVGADHQQAFTALMPISGAPLYWVQPKKMPESPEQMLPLMKTMPKITAKWTIPVYVINSHADKNVPIELTSVYIKQLKADQPKADITFATLKDAAHFDFEPFLTEVKAGYALINKAWGEQ